jgi:hypothetical protein
MACRKAMEEIIISNIKGEHIGILDRFSERRAIM